MGELSVKVTCQCCGDTDAAWHDLKFNKLFACARCWLTAAAHENGTRFYRVFISGGLRCVSGGKRNPPYRDFRKQDGRLTFSRAFRNIWCAGWDCARKAGYGSDEKKETDRG